MSSKQVLRRMVGYSSLWGYIGATLGYIGVLLGSIGVTVSVSEAGPQAMVALFVLKTSSKTEPPNKCGIESRKPPALKIRTPIPPIAYVPTCRTVPHWKINIEGR